MAAKIPKSHLRQSGLQLQYLATRSRRSPQTIVCLRCFSESRHLEITTLRKNFWKWLNGPGEYFREPPSKHNYLGAYDRFGNPLNPQAESPNRNQKPQKLSDEDDDIEDSSEANTGDVRSTGDGSKRAVTKPEELRPFPLNKDFKSEAVLSEALRDEIYRQVVEEFKTVREVSANLGVDMRRVGAVVRLKTIELDWRRQGKPLAKPYQKAVLAMVPQTHFKAGMPVTQHESINDLPVHSATTPQLFHPTSESRHFTRVDAGKVFDPDLLPADARIPHPELIEFEKDRLAGFSQHDREERHSQRLAQEAIDREEQRRQAKELEDKQTTIVKGRRWDFKFKEINSEDVGKDGRAPGTVGWRYGMPHEDRKRGQVKIPTSVP